MVGDPLQRALTEADARARARWPGLQLDRSIFLARLSGLVEDEPDPVGTLQLLRVEELFLTTACAEGIAAALREFETVLSPLVTRTVDPSRREELGQHLREKLLVGAGGPAKVSEYAGRGKLSNWLRVIVARAEVDAIRRRNAVDRTEQQFGGWAEYAESEHVQDPELEPLKRRYRAEFAAAFESSVAQLSDHHRIVLRQKVLFSHSIGEMAELHRVSGRTVKRWLAAAREALFELTRDALVERLELSTGEFTSVIRLIESQMDVSVRRVLGDPP